MDIRDRDTRWGLLIPFSPALALIYYGILVTKAKAIIKGIRSDRVTYWALIGLLISGTISAVFAQDPGYALINMPIPVVFILIYALGRWGIVNTRDFLKAVTLGCGLLGLVVFISHLMRLNIWYGSIPILARFNRGRGNVLGMADNGLAAMLEAGVTGGLGFFLYQSRHRWLYLAASFASLLGIFTTYSRGSMVGTLAAIVILIAMNSEMVRKHWKVIAAICGVTLVCIFKWPGLSARILSIVNLSTTSSNVGRLQIWQVSWNMFKDSFLFGIGPGHYGRTYAAYQPDGYLNAMSPHSLYFFVLTGWGLAGFALFFGWMGISLIKPLLQDNTPYRRIAFAMMASFWVHVLFNDLFIAHVPLIMGCIAHPDLASPSTQQQQPLEDSPPSRKHHAGMSGDTSAH
ncbi:MAG: O-antigen ligase family protein [Firmicutes bacterium]|nr:O-antigen ligase family protein [Bacillota bacterium]